MSSPEVRIVGKNETQKAFRETAQAMQALSGQAGLGGLGRGFGALNQASKLSAAGLGAVGLAGAGLIGTISAVQSVFRMTATDFEDFAAHAHSLGIAFDEGAVAGITRAQARLDKFKTWFKAEFITGVSNALLVLEQQVKQGTFFPSVPGVKPQPARAAGPFPTPAQNDIASGLAQLRLRRGAEEDAELKRRAAFDAFRSELEMRGRIIEGGPPTFDLSPVTDLFLAGQAVPMSNRRSGGGPRGGPLFDDFVGTINEAKRSTEGAADAAEEWAAGLNAARSAIQGIGGDKQLIDILGGLIGTVAGFLGGGPIGGLGALGGLVGAFGGGRMAGGAHQRALRRTHLAGVR